MKESDIDKVLDEMDARRGILQNRQFAHNAREQHWELDEEDLRIAETYTDLPAECGEDAEVGEDEA